MKKILKVLKIIGFSIAALIVLAMVFGKDQPQDRAKPAAEAPKQEVKKEEPKQAEVKKEVPKQEPVKQEAATAAAVKPVEPAKVEAKPVAKPAAKPIELTQVTPAGGLGDTMNTFKEKYGANAGDDSMARFQDDYILPIFLENRAWNITVQFEQTDKPRRSKAEALASVKGMVPADAKLVREYQHEDIHVMEYHSPTLEKAFANAKADAKKVFWGKAKPGTFMVMLGQDMDNPQLYHSAVISTGNNP